MGKSKARKGKPSPALEPPSSPLSPPVCTCGHDHDTPKAADGHNVEGWTNEDIRIYNELLTERAKLEKEKNELEQKSARHQAERALLNEDAAAFDGLFKVQLSGEYKYTGSGSCCLDPSNDPLLSRNRCHHEMCTRAKSQGISWMELDTIKYYQTRISSERTTRMKNALRKQRDVELERVKKDDDDELAVRNRRSAMLEKTQSRGQEPPDRKPSTQSQPSPGSRKQALPPLPKDNSVLEAMQANETVIRKIQAKMDRVRRDFQAGKIDATTAKSRLDETNKEMAQATTQTEQFKDLILNTTSSQDFQYAHSSLSRALSTSLSTSSKDAFSQALNVMKGFFSASDHRDVQAAIADLRSVIDMSTPASSTQFRNIKSLEQLCMLPNCRGFSVTLTNTEGVTKPCHDIVGLFLHLHRAEDYVLLRNAAHQLKIDRSLIAAFEASLEVERSASVLAIEKLTALLVSKAGPKPIFEQVKSVCDKAIKDSPLPALTEYEMNHWLEKTLGNQLGSSLWTKAVSAIKDNGEINERELQGLMISAVITYSDKLPEKYSRYIDVVATHFRDRRNSNPEVHQVLERVLDHVKSQVSVFLEKARQDQANRKTDKSPSLPQPASPQISDMDQAWDPRDSNGNHAPTLQQMFETIINSNTTMSEAAKRQLGKDLEAFNSQPSARSDKKLIARIQEHMTKLSTEYLSHIAETCYPPQSPSMGKKSNKVSKSTKESPAAKQSKFHEDLSASASTKPSPDDIQNRMDKSLADFRADLQASKNGDNSNSNAPDPGEITNTSSPPPYIANEGRARTAVKVKHVAVNTPKISGKTNGTNGTASSSSNGKAPATNLSSRESTIQMQLHKMRINLDRLQKTAEPPKVLTADGLGLKDPFMGIVGKIEEQYLGHVAMAREIASVNLWGGLGDWLDGKSG